MRRLHARGGMVFMNPLVNCVYIFSVGCLGFLSQTLFSKAVFLFFLPSCAHNLLPSARKPQVSEIQLNSSFLYKSAAPLGPGLAETCGTFPSPW